MVGGDCLKSDRRAGMNLPAELLSLEFHSSFGRSKKPSKY